MSKMKVSIIGYSGSGKSTLAEQIGEMYNYPVLHLDKINFKAGWQERNREEVLSIAEEFMKNKSWIIDGNYSWILQKKRFTEADIIIFMNFSRIVSFIQAYKRYLKNKNQVRKDMADGCIEKFDFEFIKWILFEGRSLEYKENYRETCEKYKEKIIVCSSRKDVKKLLSNLERRMFEICENNKPEEIYKLEAEIFGGSAYTLKQIEDISTMPDMYKIISVKTDNGITAGYVIVFNNSDSLEIMKIGVNPQYRQKGIGTILINEMKKSRMGIFLEVRENNNTAIEFYKKNGFKEAGKRKNYYRDTGEAAIIMVY